MVVLFVLGATVVLPITWTPVLKLYWQGPESVLPSGSCAIILGPCETRSLQQRRLAMFNYNFGTATSDHGLKRS